MQSSLSAAAEPQAEGLAMTNGVTMVGRRKINGRATNPVGLGCMSLSWAYGVPPSEDEALKLPAWGFVYLESERALKVGIA